jgi:hypothetical protein
VGGTQRERRSVTFKPILDAVRTAGHISVLSMNDPGQADVVVLHGQSFPERKGKQEWILSGANGDLMRSDGSVKARP